MKKRLLAILLIIAMLVSAAPMVFAAEVTDTRDDGVINYVSLGASNVNGYGLRGYIQGGDEIMDAAAMDWKIKAGANVLGYGSAATESYPVRIANALGAELDQLAISSMRVEEIRILLDNDYYGDSYSDWRFVGDGKWFDIATAHTGGIGGIAELRADYQSKIANADLVTVDIGANNFGVYISHQLTSNHSYDNDIALTDPKLAADYEEGKAYVKELVAEYAPEYSPMLEGYDDLIDTMTYALVGFCVNFDIVMGKIYELNPDATVVAISIQNLMDGFRVTIPGIEGVLPLGDLFGALVNAANIYIAVGSPYSDKYLCADVRKDGRVEFFLEDLIEYNGDPTTLDINILDCFNIYDGSPGNTYDSGIHVKYLLDKQTNGQYTEAMLNAAYDAVASILQEAAKVEVIDMAILSGNKAASDALSAAFKEQIIAATTAAAAGQTDYVLPENFFAGLAEKAGVSLSAIESTAAIYVRTDIGNSFFGHPNPNGHGEIVDTVLSTIANDTSGKDIMNVELDIAIEELGKYIEKKMGVDLDDDDLIYATYHGDYELGEGNYYVSLGDSSVTGMSAADGSNPEGYGNFGYKTIVAESFPYKLAKKLGLNTESQYIQLGLGAMRTIDLRYVLDENFTPDAYTMNYIIDCIDEHAGGIDAMRADHKAALAKADLVTLTIGSNNFSSFISCQISGLIAETIKSNEDLMNLLNGPMGAQIRPMIDDMVDLEAVYYKLDWDSYLDEEGWAILDAISSAVRILLTELDIPEVIDGGELIQDMLNEEFGIDPTTGKPFVTANIDLKIPAHDIAVKAFEQYIYGYVTHAFNYSAIVDKIHEFSEAEVVLLSMYNPMDKLVVKLGEAELPTGKFAGYMMKAMSTFALEYTVKHSDNTTYVNIYDTESNLDHYMNEENNVFEIMDYASIFAAGDNHATDAGHSYIAEQIYNALDLGKGDPETIENPFKDVTEKDYYFEPVMWAVSNGVTSGLSADTFGPAAGCTRAQVVTFLWRAAGKPAPTSDVNPFTDVKEGQYYYDAVLWAVENGITTGLNATSFGPNENCNRGQIVTFLWRAMGKPAPTNSNNPFNDVSEKQYYYDAVLWAVEEGITTGLSATSFGPNSTCTRGQIVTFLYRAYK